MPVDLKQLLVRMNLDDSPSYLGQTDYSDALNITNDSQNIGADTSTTNITGNRIATYNKPAGRNKTIGAKGDVIRNRVYNFIWNSNGNHSIVIFDGVTRSMAKLLESKTDSGGIDILKFQENSKIIHIDIIHRDEGDLLCWTEGTVSPRMLNVTSILNGVYPVVKEAFIEAAKRPPLSPPMGIYGSDPTRDANSLRRKLFMFTHRFVYDDFQKSTFSTYSKIPLPIGYYGSDNDNDNANNNFITVTVETGDENVAKIEIAMRNNTSNVWEDFVLVASLDKADLNIPDNSTYDFLFYNDSLYPPLDVVEVTELYDWVPRKAKSQCLPNGNYLTYGAITENYDNYPVNDLDVTITAENQTNVPPDSDPPSIIYTGGGPGGPFTFTVQGSVPEGTYYRIAAFIQSLGTVIVLAEYTSLAGDTVNDVATALYGSVSPSYATSLTAPSFSVLLGGTGGSYIVSITVTAGSAGGGDISTEKTWLWNANYLTGIVYQDEQNRDMPGVTTNANPTDSDNDFMITTPDFSLDSGDVQTPVISAEVNHLPPVGAVKYTWVRRRMTYGSFLMYETCDYQADSEYLYFCLANIEKYKEDNNQFIYGSAPITSERRIRIFAGITAGGYDGDVYTEDYQILGTVIRQLTAGGGDEDDRTFIKVKKPYASLPTAYKVNMLVMVYTPMANPTDVADSVYWEWGESYDIFTLYNMTISAPSGTFTPGETITGGTSGATAYVVTDAGANLLGIRMIQGTFAVAETITGDTSGETATVVSNVATTDRYHAGMDQDQASTQPATFTWPEGDVYFHQRVMYSDIRDSIDPPTPNTLNIMDANWSDFFESAVNDNGRGQAIEVNARDTYFPAVVRFSGAYQQNTNINQINRFYPTDFKEYDRSFADIYKLSIKDRTMRVGQVFKIGLVPLFNQISRDSAGNELVASTNQLLNPINYYAGDYGVGDSPESWVTYNSSDYFFYNKRGIWCRLSQDGITPISVLYKANSWCNNHGPLRTGNYKIYGAFDPKSNNCIMAFEETGSEQAYTLVFNEKDNAFQSFVSYHPEMMCSLGSLLLSFKNGDLYTHDSTVFNNFYGIQYPSSITPVFNDKVAVKKVYNAVSYRSNKKWASPTNGDVITSMVNPQTNLRQISQLKEVDYEIQETGTYAAFNRDANSLPDARLAVAEGDYLNGDWIKVKFICPANSTTGLVHFRMPYVEWQTSNRNF